MPRRTRARVVAFQVLFQEDLNRDVSVIQADQMIQDELQEADLVGLAREFVAGVRKFRKEIDESLEATSTNWTVHRMTATDRNILRLAAFELRHTDTPGRVVINEAVNLAKKFGTAESSQFVNGILDKLMRREGGSPPDDGPQES